MTFGSEIEPESAVSVSLSSIPPFNISANGRASAALLETLVPDMDPVQRQLLQSPSSGMSARTVLDIKGEKRLVGLRTPPEGFGRFPNHAAVNKAIEDSDAAILFVNKYQHTGPYFEQIASVYLKGKSPLFSRWGGARRPIALVLVKDKAMQEEERSGEKKAVFGLAPSRLQCQAVMDSVSRFFRPKYDKNLVEYFEMEGDGDRETLLRVVEWLVEREVNRTETETTTTKAPVSNEAKAFPTLLTPPSITKKPDENENKNELKKLLTESFSCMKSVFPWYLVDDSKKFTSPVVA